MPQVSAEILVEGCRHDTDHGAWCELRALIGRRAADTYRRANDGRIPVEMCSPETMGENDALRWPVDVVIACKKRPSAGRTPSISNSPGSADIPRRVSTRPPTSSYGSPPCV